MGLITIPPEWSEHDKSIVPICLNDRDPEGDPISSIWIDAVEAIAPRVLWLARTELNDEWRASELADDGVQALSLKYKAKTCTPTDPAKLLYVHVKWNARDKRFGGYRARKGKDVELSEYLRDDLKDPRINFASELEEQEFCEVLLATMEDLGLPDEREMLDMMRFRRPSTEIVQYFRKSRNAISHQMWRGIRKAIKNMQIRRDVLWGACDNSVTDGGTISQATN